jgi:hypothetical protein
MNIYSDADTIFPEVAKHCYTSGLKVNIIKSGSPAHLLQIDNKIILICNHLTNSTLQRTNPDLIILNSRYPHVDKEIDYTRPVETLVLTSEVAPGYQLPHNIKWKKPDSIHFVRKSGAFRTRL